jgi:hypothetical protein
MSIKKATRLSRFKKTRELMSEKTRKLPFREQVIKVRSFKKNSLKSQNKISDLLKRSRGFKKDILESKISYKKGLDLAEKLHNEERALMGSFMSLTAAGKELFGDKFDSSGLEHRVKENKLELVVHSTYHDLVDVQNLHYGLIAELRKLKAREDYVAKRS